MEGAPDPVAQAFLQKLEFSKRAQLIRTRLAQASSKVQPAAASSGDTPLASTPAAPAPAPAQSFSAPRADALRVEVRVGKRKASAAELEHPSRLNDRACRTATDATGREADLGDHAEIERKPSLWEVMLNPPAPQQHPASPRTALPQGMTYGYPPSSAGSSSYHNYRSSPGAVYDPYDAYRPQLPASPSFYASPDPNASSFSAPFSAQARSTPITSSMRGHPGSAAGLAMASPKRLSAGVSDAGLRVPSSGGRYAGSSGSFGRSPSSTFSRPPNTAAAANHSYAQGLTTSPIINSSPKISSARTSIPSGAPVTRPSPSLAGSAKNLNHPSPLGVPVPLHYPPGFGPPAQLPLRLQQHRQRLGGIGSPSSPKADGSPSGQSMPGLVRGHRRSVSSTLSAVVNFQNAQRSSPQAKGPVEEYLTHRASPGRSPRKQRRSPPPSAPAQLGKPSNLADISAASALTAMLTSTGSASSHRGSTEPSESGASSLLPLRARSLTPPSIIRRSSKTGAPGEEDAAGMLMFFHHSPSPAKPRLTPRPRDVSGTGPPPPAASARGRVLLFGEDEPSSGGGFGASIKANVSPSSASPAKDAGLSSRPSTRQGSQRSSPRKARLGSSAGVSPEKKPSGERNDSTGGESGKENRAGPGGEGDPDSSSSSLFSHPSEGAEASAYTVPPAAPASPSPLTAATSLASSHPGQSPPSPSTGLLTPAPSSLPSFISPARSSSMPGINFPPPSASTHASPDRPPPGTAIRTGFNPTLAPSSVVQAGATASWPDFGYLGEPASARKQALDSVAERTPSVPLNATQLGGIA